MRRTAGVRMLALKPYPCGLNALQPNMRMQALEFGECVSLGEWNHRHIGVVNGLRDLHIDYRSSSIFYGLYFLYFGYIFFCSFVASLATSYHFTCHRVFSAICQFSALAFIIFQHMSVIFSFVNCESHVTLGDLILLVHKHLAPLF